MINSKSVYSNERSIKSCDYKFVFKNKKYELNKKYSIDGIKLMKDLNDEVISTIFFDPQYRGILDKMSYGNEGKPNSRQLKRSELTQMSDEIIIKFIKEINRILIKSGHLFLWIDKFHLCEGISGWIRKTDLSIVDMIVWDKTKMGMGYRTRRQSEYLLVLQKEPVKAKGVWKTRNIRDVWVEKIVNKVHPHQKPIELQKALIEAVSNPFDIILDPCAGSFSVMESANLCNRFFLGTDLKNNGKN